MGFIRNAMPFSGLSLADRLMAKKNKDNPSTMLGGSGRSLNNETKYPSLIKKDISASCVDE